MIIVVLGVVGSGLTVWNYSQHVFSSNRGKVIDFDGIVEVSFPKKAALKIHAHQSARVTFEVKDAPKKIVHDAVVISVDDDVVTLRLTPPMLEKLTLGEACSVTVDTTIPPLP